MIAAVRFQNFKALRRASVQLAPCNLVVGSNGSGKTSLIQSLLRLRTLARLPLKAPVAARDRRAAGPEISFTFNPPFGAFSAVLRCVHDAQCDLLDVDPPDGAATEPGWVQLREALLSVRAYLFDHYAMALPAPLHATGPLASNGGNLAAVLAHWERAQPAAFAGLQEELCRLLPEYDRLTLAMRDGGTAELLLTLRDGSGAVTAENLSQGTLYVLGLCTLAHDPDPPAVLCIEEVDRGLHPRLLRSVRDLLYRLAYPRTQGLERAPVQVVATSHSPYLLDQFRDHPEEVILAEKHGTEATFRRLSERTDLPELLAENSLGDLWYAGILGGVPEEP